MPRYDYLCQKCKKIFEVSMTYDEKDKGIKPKCPDCGGIDVIQVFGNIGFISGNKSGSTTPPFCGPSQGSGCCG